MKSSETMPRWRRHGRLPEGFTTAAAHARPDSSGWLAGWQGTALAERWATLLAVGIDGGLTVAHRQPGWCVAVDATDNRVAVLIGEPGPRFRVLSSTDHGQHWTTHPSHATSLTQIRLGPAGSIWALGADTVGCWHRGLWQPVEPPCPINHVRDRLFIIAEHPVLATVGGLYIWRASQRKWARRPLDGAHIRALCWPYVASAGAGGVRLGRLTADSVDWLGTISGVTDVEAMSWAHWPGTRSPALQLALHPAPPHPSPGLLLVRSAPSGGLTTHHLGTTTGRIALAGAQGGLFVGVCRSIHQSVSEATGSQTHADG